ncbi:MAG: reverse transcriptase-like protein [Anaerolineales bacterium]
MGNPGRAYGSFRIIPGGAGGPTRIQRREFGRGTNNEAEYWTLIAGLEDLHAALEERGERPEDVDLIVRGDSRLVLEQVRGRWKTREPRMKELCDMAQRGLTQFRSVRLVHQPRSQTVRALGH